jgi:hypothetical protein
VLPALTHRPPRLPPRRAALGAASALLAIAAFVAGIPAAQTTPERGLSDELSPATWAMRVPISWFAAPAPPVRRSDAIDVFAIRGGDRAHALPVAYGLSVLASDDEGLTLELDEEDALSIASAHGAGMLLLALLRSAR